MALHYLAAKVYNRWMHPITGSDAGYCLIGIPLRQWRLLNIFCCRFSTTLAAVERNPKIALTVIDDDNDDDYDTHNDKNGEKDNFIARSPVKLERLKSAHGESFREVARKDGGSKKQV